MKLLSAIYTVVLILALIFTVVRMATDPQPMPHAQTVIRLLLFITLTMALAVHLRRAC